MSEPLLGAAKGEGLFIAKEGARRGEDTKTLCVRGSTESRLSLASVRPQWTRLESAASTPTADHIL